ncbi:hypothetical protein ACFV1L_09100 [Kitasatospora sp. NPDC059646]|uniref:hypothetical protein n=1 Tax=Kitasatospora sp. NPDC059646 TaxID=3346893 RepID=UPI003673A156
MNDIPELDVLEPDVLELDVPEIGAPSQDEAEEPDAGSASRPRSCPSARNPRCY